MLKKVTASFQKGRTDGNPNPGQRMVSGTKGRVPGKILTAQVKATTVGGRMGHVSASGGASGVRPHSHPSYSRSSSIDAQRTSKSRGV